MLRGSDDFRTGGSEDKATKKKRDSLYNGHLSIDTGTNRKNTVGDPSYVPQTEGKKQAGRAASH
jgi:hypothetical protein